MTILLTHLKGKFQMSVPEEKLYCNVYIKIFSKSKDNKDGKQAINKLEKLVEENFKGELTMSTRYPF